MTTDTGLTAAAVEVLLVDPGMPEGLAPILKDSAVPLLPVGTKPLIAHWLERIAELGVRRARVLLSHWPERTRRFVGDGSRWGLELECVTVREDQRGAALWPTISDLNANEVMLVNLTRWPRPIVVDVLREAGAAAIHVDAHAFLERLDGVADAESWRSMRSLQDDGAFETLESMAAYWQLNMRLASGELVDPLPYGFEAEPGVWVSGNCRVDGSCAFSGATILGESSIVGARTLLGPEAVIGDHVVIEEGASVRRAVVFPRAFVGSHIAISDAIVAGDVLYNVESDVLLYINDAEIVARRDRVGARVTLGQRLMAALLIALISPGWLLITLGLMLTGRKPWLQERRYIEAGLDLSGGRLFTPLSLPILNVTHPLWRHSPWLLAVLGGELMLVGTSPRLTDDLSYPDWVTPAELFQPGAISLAKLTGVALDDTESTIVSDAYQLARGQLGLHAGMIGRWLAGLLKF